MPERTPHRYRLHLPVPLDAASAQAALTAAGSVSGQPRLVLEARASAGAVEWHLVCERWALSRVLAGLSAQLPGLRCEPLSADVAPWLTRAARLRFRGDDRFPLNDAATEAVVRGVLGGLARTRAGEQLVLQLILGPRRRPGGLGHPETRTPRDVARKQRQHRAECELRIGVTAEQPARAGSLIQGVAASRRALEVPGVWLQLSRARPGTVEAARSPLLWGNRLAMSDLVPLTAWPVGEPPLPGVASPHPRALPALSQVPRRGRTLGVSALDPNRTVALSVEDSLRHLHVLGPTGVGKSTLLARLALADIEAGRGTVVIDPKGDLVEDLLARIPEQRHGDVVVLDARDPRPVGINGLHDPADPDLMADTLLSVFHSLYADSWGPRTQDILHASLLTLARRGDASLALIPPLLTNPGFRRSIIGRVTKADPMGLGAFWGWFDAISDAERTQAIAPLMNKLRPLLLRPGLRGIFGQRTPRFSLDQVFTERKILLVSLAKGQVGPEAATLLGSLVVALLWAAAQRRTALPAAARRPVMIHIDEVQDYLRLPGDLGDALAQARGLGVGFTLAHQHLGQLPRSLRDAVLANARSRVAFTLSARDARDIASLSAGEVTADDLTALPAFEAYTALLTGGTPASWCSLRTQPLPDRLQSPRVVRRRSAETYGRPLAEIEDDLFLTATPPSRDGDGETFGRVPSDGKGDQS